MSNLLNSAKRSNFHPLKFHNTTIEHMMKYYLLLTLVSVSALSCKNDLKNSVESNEKETVTAVRKTKSSFEDLDGNPVELSDFKGKKVFLNYWATWCRPCIEEMPAMLRAQEVLNDENYVFLLASDQSTEKIKAFKDKKKFDFNFLKFNGSLADMQINALPATFIYNESGEFINRVDGATEWDSPKIIDKLKAIK